MKKQTQQPTKLPSSHILKNNLWRENLAEEDTIGSPSATTGLRPTAPPQHTPIRVRLDLHRLRLGHQSFSEIIHNSQPEPCSHCDTQSPTPLLQFLLGCVATQAMRAVMRSNGDTRINRAAGLIARTPDEELTHIFISTIMIKI